MLEEDLPDRDTTVNIISWSIHRVKNNFECPTINDIFQKMDIILINETHFNIQSRELYFETSIDK